MPANTFPKRARLLEAREFTRVFNDAGVRVPEKQVLLLACANELGYPRLGVVVGKKNCRRSTGRNRIKRVMRESFRCRAAAIGSFDLILLARQGIADLDNAAIRTILDRLWTRLSQKAAARPAPSQQPPAG